MRYPYPHAIKFCCVSAKLESSSEGDKPASETSKGGVPLGRRKKLINNTDIPQHEIEKIARCLLPDILAYYDSEEGQQEFTAWKAEREQTQTQDSDT